jgi:hypothetical protein
VADIIQFPRKTSDRAREIANALAVAIKVIDESETSDPGMATLLSCTRTTMETLHGVLTVE